MKVLWERQAQAGREDIWHYLYQEAGLQVVNAADERFILAITLLKTTPEAGIAVAGGKNIRKLIIPRLPLLSSIFLKRIHSIF